MDWFRTPGGGGFGSGLGAPFGADGSMETESIRVELIGAQLRAAGALTAGKGARLSDYVNMLAGFFRLREVTLFDRRGKPTDIAFPELRVRLDDIELVGQSDPRDGSALTDGDRVAKRPRRAIVMTAAHIVYGSVYLLEDASLSDFVDATDPRFMPMTDVRLRSLSDRSQAGRFPFALVQRSRVLAVASGDGDPMVAGDTDVTAPGESEAADGGPASPAPAGA